MCEQTPSPDSEAFEFWVRKTALDAATTLMSGYLSRAGGTASAPGDTMYLVGRFEHYLNTGSKDDPRQ